MKKKILIFLVMGSLTLSGFTQESDLVIDYIISPHNLSQSRDVDNNKNYLCVGIKNLGYGNYYNNFKIRVTYADISFGDAQSEIKKQGGYIYPEEGSKNTVCVGTNSPSVDSIFNDFDLMPQQSKMIKIDLKDWILSDNKDCSEFSYFVDVKLTIIPVFEEDSKMNSQEYMELYEDDLSNNTGYLYEID